MSAAVRDRHDAHEPEDKLEANAMGVTSIVFLVVATAAPLTAMGAALPVAIGFGNGIGAPGGFLLAGLVLALFAFGYAAMSQHVANAGAFFAYVTTGLGRRMGMSAGFVAMLAYNAITLYVVALAGYFAEQTFNAELGVHISWVIFAFAFMGIALLLGRFGVELNARTLGIFLILETSLLLLIDVATLVTKGPSAFPLSSFSPSNVFGGPAAGIGLMFAFTSFIGFEGTAIFGEEAKDPRKTIPRSTLVAVAFVGIVYTITAWALVGANGGTEAVAMAAEDPGAFTFTAAQATLGTWSTHAMSWLMLSSLFAVVIALHNMASRYLFAFGREGVLPRSLGRTHRRYKTPFAAASVQIGLMSVLVIAYAVAGADPYLNLASQMAGLGTLGVLVLEVAVCAAVVVFFRRRGDRRWWTTLIAPVGAGIGLTAGSILVIVNYASLTGSHSTLVNQMPWLLVVVAVIGYVVGTVRPLRRPVNIFADEEPTAITAAEVWSEAKAP